MSFLCINIFKPLVFVIILFILDTFSVQYFPSFLNYNNTYIILYSGLDLGGGIGPPQDSINKRPRQNKNILQ